MKFTPGHPQWRHQAEVAWVKLGDFLPISRYISEMVQDVNRVTTEG